MQGISGIHHLAFATGSMDRTLRFWRDLIGLRVQARLGGPGYRQYFLAAGKQALLSFFEWPGAEPVPEKDHGTPVRGPFTFDHVALEVADEESLWEIKDRIEAAGFWVSEVMDHGCVRSIYSFDPNGIPVEFSLAVPALDVRLAPLLADREPSPVALEGVEPTAGKWPAAQRTPPQDRRTYPGAGSEYFHGTKRV